MSDGASERSPAGRPTRVELWTAPGAGGVAVVVLRGGDPAGSLARLGVDRPRAGSGPRLVRLRDGADDLDEALLVTAPEGGRVELHLHGSPPLVERVLEVLGGAADAVDPVDPFDPFDAGDPADPAAERAWRRVGGAPSELGARILIDAAEGAFAAEVERLAGLDADGLARAAEELLERGRVARFLLERSTVALVGKVNAGKSTLFNLLLGSERTVVSAERGTTRDAIAEEGRLGGWPVLLVDTAGRRALPDRERHAVERAGQRLAAQVGREADWVLELVRAPGSPAPAPGSARASGPVPTDRVLTCCDELPGEPADWPAGGVSALARPERAVGTVRAAFERRFRLPALDRFWRPGLAVPVEDELRSALEGLRDAARGARPGPSTRPWLERLVALSR